MPRLSISGPRDRDDDRVPLELRGEVEIACAECGEKLMKFLITRSNNDLAEAGLGPVHTRVICECGLCGGVSDEWSIEGAFHPGIYDDSLVFDMLDSKEHDLMVFRVWRRR